jgi:hypothetical protein
MFLIPSQQIPDLFDIKIVNEDFEIICKRASSILGISTQKLMNALQQSAEDELQHRFQKAIQKVHSPHNTPTGINHLKDASELRTISPKEGSAFKVSKETKKQIKDSPSKSTPLTKQTACSVEACVVKKITKPQYIDGKLYCAAHYKQINAKNFPLSSKTTNDPYTEEKVPGCIDETLTRENTDEVYARPIQNDENRAYWSCVPISYTDTTGQEVHYKLHKPTGIILDKITQEDGHLSFVLIGHYDEDNFTDKTNLDPTLLDWCRKSGIVI